MHDLGQGTPAMSNWLSPGAVPNTTLPTSTASSAATPNFDFSTPQSTTHPPSNPASTINPVQPIPGGAVDPMEMGNTFTHPFIPQDLWQMPMTLEWDWADMTASSGYGSFEGVGGLGMNGVINDAGSAAATSPGLSSKDGSR